MIDEEKDISQLFLEVLQEESVIQQEYDDDIESLFQKEINKQDSWIGYKKELRTIISKAKRYYYYILKCECGYISEACLSDIKRNDYKNHNNCKNKIKVGDKIGQRIVLDIIKINNVSNMKLKCSECGIESIIKKNGKNILNRQCPSCVHKGEKESTITQETINKIIGSRNGFRTITDIFSRKSKDGKKKRAVKTKCICGSINITDYGDFKRAEFNSHHTCNSNIYTQKNIQIGDKFNKWTVISLDEHRDKYNNYLTSVKCECGTINKVMLDSLIKNDSKQCIKCSHAKRRKSLLDETLLYRKIICIIPHNQRKKIKVKLECSCGKIDEVSYYNIIKNPGSKCRSCCNRMRIEK